MDMNMPKMGGKEAAAKMREINNNCKIVAITGFSDIQFHNNECRENIIAIVKKPFRIKNLISTLHKLLLQGS